MRVMQHPILGEVELEEINIVVDGKQLKAQKGETVAAALLANGIKPVRTTSKQGKNRGVFCGIGLCTDCMMTVNGIPNVRTCVTPVEAGMVIQTQHGLGEWSETKK